jgi:hypothetical protein
MNDNLKYPIGYRPMIYTASFTIKYYNKKYHSILTGPKTKVSIEAQKHIKEFHIPIAVIILDDNNQFPTEKMKEQIIMKHWKKHGPKTNRDEFMVGIRNIKIINNQGRVSYDFDETKN